MSQASSSSNRKAPDAISLEIPRARCVYTHQTLTLTEDSRKTLVSLLGKLNLPEGEETEAWKIQAVSVLLASIRSVRTEAFRRT